MIDYTDYNLCKTCKAELGIRIIDGRMVHTETDSMYCNAHLPEINPNMVAVAEWPVLDKSALVVTEGITADQITAELDSSNPWNEPAVGPARESKRTARIRVHHWFPNEEHESNTDVFGIVQGNYDQFRENCVWINEVAPITGTESTVNRIRAYVYAVWASVEFGTDFPDPICIPGSHNDYHTYYAIAGE